MIPVARSITLHRQGKIAVRVTGEHHCGDPSAVVDGMVAVRYIIGLTVDANGLDEHGFLVDQEALHNLMRDIGMSPVAWREPCELLAFIWGDRVLRWVSVTNTRCTIQEFYLTLSPEPGLGSFTAHYGTQARAAMVAVPARSAIN